MRIYRIARWVIFAGLVVSIFLLFKTPDPVSKPQDSHTIAANVESYQSKMQQLEEAKQHGEAAEVHLTSDEVSAAMSQAASIPAPAVGPTSKNADQSAEQPKIGDYQVSFEGDVARGQFSTVAGRQTSVRHSWRPPGSEEWIRHLRSYGIQSWRSQCPSFAGE